MNVNIRIAGEAGQGVKTTGDLLVNALADAGFHVFSSQSYLSRIRGGINWYDIRIADRELFSPTSRVDLLVAMTSESYELLKDELTIDSVALTGGHEAPHATAMDFVQAARDVGGSEVMANTVAAGAVYETLGLGTGSLVDYLAFAFEKKGAEVVATNVKCAERGAELAREREVPTVKAPPIVRAPGVVANGAEAVGLAAAVSGVKMAAAYPMTPSTGVFTYLASVSDEYGIVVEQAEDEIAAVNMLCGAVYAGVPAMAMTSGGGFALMAEGLSLAGMMELPIVILLSQRPGPATGLPTRTAQEDLRFAIHAGHGEFPRAVFAPGTIKEAYYLTRHALEIAHEYQTPVIIMMDQFLADMKKNVGQLEASLRPIDRHVVLEPEEDYVRYEITADGVSPRALPGGEVFVLCDSDEHWSDGHITEDLGMRVQMVDKRLRKGAGMASEALVPEWYGAEDAETVFVCWGSTYGPCREAVETMSERWELAAVMHFGQVWPVNAAAAQSLLDVAERKRVIVVEGNATGQFASILRETGVRAECELMSKYNGMPFTADEILEGVAS